MASSQKFSRLTLAAMVIGSMVGAGIFPLPARFGTATGPFGTIVAWLIPGGGILMLALLMGGAIKATARVAPGRSWPRALVLGAALALGSGAVAGSEGTDPIPDHFERGQAYLDKGEYALAVLEFEQVLTFDNLPPDLHQQAEIYARAARNYKAGQRLSGFGYAETGGGYYRENVTRSTNAAGGDPTRDWFWKARAGGGLGYILGSGFSLDGTLDYRFRYYDDTNRRDDSDLRWSAVLNQSLDHGSRALGMRGQASYLGLDGYRQDYGLFANQSFNLDALNRITLEVEIRSRQYPPGELKVLSRDIGEFWLSWTRSLFDGRGSLTLSANGGQEWATHDRPDGDQNFYGATFDFSIDLNYRLGFFLSGLYEHNAFADERMEIQDDLTPPPLYTRNDDLYELEAGLTWMFSSGWSLRPQVLYLRDESNTLWGNYSSTELWMMVRRSF